MFNLALNKIVILPDFFVIFQQCFLTGLYKKKNNFFDIILIRYSTKKKDTLKTIGSSLLVKMLFPIKKINY